MQQFVIVVIRAVYGPPKLTSMQVLHRGGTIRDGSRSSSFGFDLGLDVP